jgi:hypothetical protein
MTAGHSSRSALLWVSQGHREDLLEHADAAMYFVKGLGRNVWSTPKARPA